MTQYFDTRTGALVGDFEGRQAVENRLAQSHPVVPVTGQAVEVIEAGRKALKLKENDVGALQNDSDMQPRPEAIETAAQAKKNYEAALKEEAERAGTARSERVPTADDLAAMYGEEARPVEEKVERKPNRRKATSKKRTRSKAKSKKS